MPKAKTAAPSGVERIQRPEPLTLRGSTLFEGDALTVLRRLPSGSVRCVVTSPPYWGLRDYGVAGQVGRETTPEGYVATLVEIFRGVRRVLRDDGTLWLNLGDCYAGYWGAKYAHKPFGDDRTADASTPPNKPSFPFHASSIKPKDLLGLPWRVAFALQEQRGHGAVDSAGHGDEDAHGVGGHAGNVRRRVQRGSAWAGGRRARAGTPLGGRGGRAALQRVRGCAGGFGFGKYC